MESLKNLFKEIFTEKYYHVIHLDYDLVWHIPTCKHTQRRKRTLRKCNVCVLTCQGHWSIRSVLFMFLSACSLSLPSSLLPSLHINSNLVWNLNCFRSHYPLMELHIFFIAAFSALASACTMRRSHSETSQGKHLRLLTLQIQISAFLHEALCSECP